MVTIMGNKFRVRTSVSVLAMVLSASMALAEDAQISASTEGVQAEAVPEVIVCELYPGPEDSVDAVKVDDSDGAIVLEEGPELTVDPIPGDGGEGLPIYFMTTDEPTTPEMVQRNEVLTALPLARESVARDPAAVPDLCDIAGPGLGWLCGDKTQ